MCVQNCEVTEGPPCGGINTDPSEKEYENVQQCCLNQLPSVAPSECTNADVSDWATTTSTTSTSTSTTPKETSTATTLAATTSTTTVDTSLFYVDWNAGLLGMCVQNCDGPSPCGGINKSASPKFFTSVQQCCQEQLPNKLPNDCTDADVSDWVSGPYTLSLSTCFKPVVTKQSSSFFRFGRWIQ